MKVGIFDTETDLLVSNSAIPLDKQPRIAEFFGTTVDQYSTVTGQEEVAKVIDGSDFDLLMSIGRPMNEKAGSITGITDEMLKGQPSFKVKGPEVKAWVEKHDRVVAHNLAFDKQVVDMQMELNGLAKINWPELVCTVEATEFLKGYRLSLSALHEELFGEKFEGAHRAKVDVRALVRCYIEIVNRGWI